MSPTPMLQPVSNVLLLNWKNHQSPDMLRIFCMDFFASIMYIELPPQPCFPSVTRVSLSTIAISLAIMASSTDKKISNDTKSSSVLQDSKELKSGNNTLVYPSHSEYPPPPPSSHPARGMASIEDDDERLLARIGYRQVLNTKVLVIPQFLTIALSGASA
jgi:hypothetical protein